MVCNTNFTSNSWQVEAVANIPLSQSVSVHTILTNPNTTVSGVYGLPLNPVNGQQSYIKDINANANVSPITLVCTSGNTIDSSSSNFVINTANDTLGLMYYGLTGSNGNWITLGSQLYTNLNSVSNGQTLTYNSSSKKSTNITPSTGVTSLSALTDVNVSSLSNSQVLSYNSTSSKWVNATLPSGVTPQLLTMSSDTVKLF